MSSKDILVQGDFKHEYKNFLVRSSDLGGVLTKGVQEGWRYVDTISSRRIQCLGGFGYEWEHDVLVERISCEIYSKKSTQ